MTREIKCRAMGRDSDEWYYGYYAVLDGEAVIITEKQGTFYVRPETVGQYTGLKDKDGREMIYEGDIVRRISSDKTVEIVAVEYQAPRFNIGDFVSVYGYRVIGNIHENPELLK